MGKRELLLIVAFVIVGAVVYQATAPPSGPNERSLSFSRILDHIRREMRGNPARAELTTVSTHELDPGMTEVRISGSYAELVVTGEKNRTSIEARFRVMSNAYDEPEAKQLAAETKLISDRAGTSLQFAPLYPKPGRQHTYLTLLVPTRFIVRVDQGASRTTIANVASVEIPAIRGETSLTQIVGKVTVAHRAGRIVIDDVASLKLTGRGSEAIVSNVRGDASFSMQSGELNVSGVSGPIDVESQSTDVTLKKLDTVQGPLRVNAVGGSITLEGLQGDARIDGRNTEIDIIMSKPAPVAVYNQGDERIDLTIPPGGFALDARVTRGRLTLPDDLRGQFSTSGEGDEQEHRANGAVRGGGPTITLRANRGDITLRGRDAEKPER